MRSSTTKKWLRCQSWTLLSDLVAVIARTPGPVSATEMVASSPRVSARTVIKSPGAKVLTKENPGAVGGDDHAEWHAQRP